MSIFSKLWSAIARLAGSIELMADTCDEMRLAMRQRVGLDSEPVAVDGTEQAALPEPKRRK